MIKVGIVGGTGYTGVELLRILANHPEAEVVKITSRAEQGVRVDEMYPNLRGFYDLAFTLPEAQQLADCDVGVFCDTAQCCHENGTGTVCAGYSDY